jgi:electron transfer flavoprotein beta subunit
MRIIVPVKRVPDTASARRFDPATSTVDRESTEAVLCPVNEYAIEEALRIKERTDAQVTVLIVGPESARPITQKALSYGLDDAVHVSDEGIAGSDALGTARVIAAALRHLEPWDLVMFGNQSTDARTSLVPAAVGELLGLPSITYVRHLELGEGSLVAHREHEEGWDVVSAPVPAVVSVVEAINEPRFPSFKGIIAAKSKSVETLDLAAIGVESGSVGASAAAATIVAFEPRPPKPAGTIVADDGEGGAVDALVSWMAERKFV